MAISILYYIVLAKGNLSFLLRMWQFWLGHWPTYTRAFWIAVRSRRSKPSYVVTRKTHQNGFYGHLLWPQFLFILIGATAITRALFWMPDTDLSMRLSNSALLLVICILLSGICRAAFVGVTMREIYLTLSGNLFGVTRRAVISGIAAMLLLLTRNRS
jgi:hypothetical protein